MNSQPTENTTTRTVCVGTGKAGTLTKLLTSPKQSHIARITKKDGFGELIRTMDLVSQTDGTGK